MRYFPVFLDLEGKTIAVAGGGEVAANKLRLFAKTGAKLICTALSFNEEITGMIEAGRVTGRKLDPKWAQFGDAFVVVAATESIDDEVIATRAKSLGMLVNAVDKTEFCTFITPSFADRSPVIVAIGTEGQAPVLARRLREQIEALLPEYLGPLAAFIGSHREVVSEVLPNTPQRRRFWENVVDGPIARLIADGRSAHALEALQAALDQVAERTASRLEGEDQGSEGTQAATDATRSVTFIESPSMPEDLTLKALRALQDADAILYSDGVPGSVLDKARRDASRFVFSEMTDLETRLSPTAMEREAMSRSVCLFKPGHDAHSIQQFARLLVKAGIAVDICNVARPLLHDAATGLCDNSIEQTNANRTALGTG